MAKTSASVAPSESSIRKQCGARVFERGQALAGGRNLTGLTRAGDELFARCAGSYDEPYQLHARLENGAVTQSSCSCPFEGDGWCKHLVALLLRYNQAPADFRGTASLAEMVGALSRDELNLLLENLMRREPQLLANLSQIYAANTSDDASGPADLRARLRSALSGRGADEGRVALELAVNEATQTETQQDWARAGEIWRVLLEELVLAAPHFEEITEEEAEEDRGGNYYDDDIEIDVGQQWAESAVAGLHRALGQDLAPPLRAEMLQTLWQCWRDAEECDYLELPEATIDPVLDAATPPLWGEVEAFLLERLQNSRDARDEQTREHALGCLAQGWDKRGQTERATQMLRQHGSYAQRLALLMDEKNWDAAEKLALENETAYNPSLLTVAQWFEKAEQIEAAERLARRARELASSYTAAPILEWLTRFYLRRQNAEAAQAQAAALFVVRPDVAALELWKSAIAQGDDWDDWDNRYPRLEKAPKMTTLLRVQLAILDERAVRALELFRLLNGKEKGAVAEDLARLCQAELPREAIEIYQQLGDAAIAARSGSEPRLTYKRVAQYWKNARELHQKLGASDNWEQFIGAKREEYKRFSALLEELKKAGL